MVRPVSEPEAIADIELIGRGLSSTNYRVRRRAASPLHLRIVPAGREVCEKEVAIYRYVRGTIPVPQVWHAAAHARQPHYIAEWIDASPLDTVLAQGTVEDPSGLGAAVASVLATIHGHEFDSEGDLNGALQVVSWNEQLDWQRSERSIFVQMMEHFIFNSPAHARLGEARAQALWERAVARDGALRDRTQRCCLVHSDYNPKNLLVQRDVAGWNVAAVLDWEFACAGGPLLDVGNLLRHREDYPDEFANGFIDRYKSVASWLADDWLMQAQLVDLTSAVESLSSTQERAGPHAIAVGIVDRFLSD